MIKDVTFEHTQYHAAPGRFEAGTGNIADAVGLEQLGRGGSAGLKRWVGVGGRRTPSWR